MFWSHFGESFGKMGSSEAFSLDMEISRDMMQRYWHQGAKRALRYFGNDCAFGAGREGHGCLVDVCGPVDEPKMGHLVGLMVVIANTSPVKVPYKMHSGFLPRIVILLQYWHFALQFSFKSLTVQPPLQFVKLDVFLLVGLHLHLSFLVPPNKDFAKRDLFELIWFQVIGKNKSFHLHKLKGKKWEL